MNPPSPSRSSDLELARRIVSGDIEAWHAFIEDYSRLIFSVVSRYLPRESEDNRRMVFVEVLDTVRRDKLGVYDGQCALSTWITLITRRRCLDHVRSTFGRRRRPAWLAKLSAEDQEVYRLHFVEGLDYAQTCTRMRARHGPFELERLCQALARIESHMSARLGRRLAYDLQARSHGAISGRLLEYLDYVRAENASSQEAQQPDQQLAATESREQICRLQELLKQIPSLEREVVEKFYYESWTAKRITTAYGLADQRRAYTLISRALRRLRRMLEPEPVSPSPPERLETTPD